MTDHADTIRRHYTQVCHCHWSSDDETVLETNPDCVIHGAIPDPLEALLAERQQAIDALRDGIDHCAMRRTKRGAEIMRAALDALVAEVEQLRKDNEELVLQTQRDDEDLNVLHRQKVELRAQIPPQGSARYQSELEQQVEQLRAERDAARKSLAATNHELEETEDAFAVLRVEKQQLADTANERINSLEAECEAYEAREQRLQEALRQIIDIGTVKRTVVKDGEFQLQPVRSVVDVARAALAATDPEVQHGD